MSDVNTKIVIDVAKVNVFAVIRGVFSETYSMFKRSTMFLRSLIFFSDIYSIRLIFHLKTLSTVSKDYFTQNIHFKTGDWGRELAGRAQIFYS